MRKGEHDSSKKLGLRAVLNENPDGLDRYLFPDHDMGGGQKHLRTIARHR